MRRVERVPAQQSDICMVIAGDRRATCRATECCDEVFDNNELLSPLGSKAALHACSARKRVATSSARVTNIPS
jgi:hypothetical protein